MSERFDTGKRRAQAALWRADIAAGGYFIDEGHPAAVVIRVLADLLSEGCDEIDRLRGGDNVNDIDLDALEALYPAASPVPWVPDIDDPQEPGGGTWTGKVYTGDEAHAGTWEVYSDDPRETANVRLATAMVNAGPPLIAEVRRLRGALAEERVRARGETTHVHAFVNADDYTGNAFCECGEQQ